MSEQMALAVQVSSPRGVEPDLSRSIPLWRFMTLDEAYYIIDDLTLGQLDSLTPAHIVDFPETALILYKAARLVYANCLQRRLSRTFTAFDRECQWWAATVIGQIDSIQASSRYGHIHAWIIASLNGPVERAVTLTPPPPEPPPARLLPATAVKTDKPKTPRTGYVYVLRSTTGAYKIGYTTNPANRVRTFSVKLPFEVEYDTLIKTNDMRGLEAELHGRYADKRIGGEWFALTDDDLAELRAMGGAS